MLALIVRIFAFCLWFSYITSTARGCYLCALQNKPHSALLCYPLSPSGSHQHTIYYNILGPRDFHIYPFFYPLPNISHNHLKSNLQQNLLLLSTLCVCVWKKEWKKDICGLWKVKMVKMQRKETKKLWAKCGAGQAWPELMQRRALCRKRTKWSLKIKWLNWMNNIVHFI